MCLGALHLLGSARPCRKFSFSHQGLRHLRFCSAPCKVALATGRQTLSFPRLPACLPKDDGSLAVPSTHNAAHVRVQRTALPHSVTPAEKIGKELFAGAQRSMCCMTSCLKRWALHCRTPSWPAHARPLTPAAKLLQCACADSTGRHSHQSGASQSGHTVPTSLVPHPEKRMTP